MHIMQFFLLRTNKKSYKEKIPKPKTGFTLLKIICTFKFCYTSFNIKWLNKKEITEMKQPPNAVLTQAHVYED